MSEGPRGFKQFNEAARMALVLAQGRARRFGQSVMGQGPIGSADSEPVHEEGAAAATKVETVGIHVEKEPADRRRPIASGSLEFVVTVFAVLDDGERVSEEGSDRGFTLNGVADPPRDAVQVALGRRVFQDIVRHWRENEPVALFESMGGVLRGRVIIATPEQLAALPFEIELAVSAEPFLRNQTS